MQVSNKSSFVPLREWNRVGKALEGTIHDFRMNRFFSILSGATLDVGERSNSRLQSRVRVTSLSHDNIVSGCFLFECFLYIDNR
jgi:hypothetical protein